MRRLTASGDAGSLRAVKLILPLLALTLLLTGCSNTEARRRNLYSPSQPSGPYTRSLQDGSWMDRGRPVEDETQDRGRQPQPR